MGRVEHSKRDVSLPHISQDIEELRKRLYAPPIDGDADDKGLEILARIEEQFEAVRVAVDAILERDGICPLCEYIPGTREDKQQHYVSCAMDWPGDTPHVL